MSFSADKVPVLKGSFSQRRFSTSKDPSGNGKISLSRCRLDLMFLSSIGEDLVGLGTSAPQHLRTSTPQHLTDGHQRSIRERTEASESHTKATDLTPVLIPLVPQLELCGVQTKLENSG